MEEENLQETTVLQVQEEPEHKKKHKHKKKEKKLTKGGVIFFRIVLVAALAVAGYSGWNIYSGLKAYRESVAVYDNLAKPVHAQRAEAAAETVESVPYTVDFAELEKINPDVVGWLRLEDTVIDYPVVQCEDNDYYLTHLFDGTVNSSGTIFVDCRNSPGFTDRNTAFYAHHMRNGSMFAEIEKYETQEYADAHPKFRFETPDAIYDIIPFAGLETNSYTDYIKLEFDDDADFLRYVSDIQAKSTFTTNTIITKDDHIVTFSTCSYHSYDGRFALYGKLVPATND